MIPINFYKIRTGLDIRTIAQGGNAESNARYEQIVQTISQRSDIEFLSNEVHEIEETSPSDLGFYEDQKVKLYVLIFGLDKTRSSWTGHLLNQEFGNMSRSKNVLNANPNAEEWVGGVKNNISCSAAFFDLRSKKKKK